MNIIQFLSAFGLGAIFSAFIQGFLAYRIDLSKRRFQEKKECYIGFLDAIYKSDKEQNADTSFYLSHWINRIELIGSKDVQYQCLRFL